MPVQQIRHQVLRAYCQYLYTVVVGGAQLMIYF